MRGRYVGVTRAAKGVLLDEFSRVPGYHRKPAIRVLGRGRPRRYGPEGAASLRQVWDAADRPCGKRLPSFLGEFVRALEPHGEIVIPPCHCRRENTQICRFEISHLRLLGTLEGAWLKTVREMFVVKARLTQGQSVSVVARELGIDRKTVR
jgi:hypothetical protein